MSTKPKPAKGSKLSPFRILGVVWQGKRIREVWDCRCKCGVFWAVQRDHLMSGREMMCGVCKTKAAKEQQ